MGIQNVLQKRLQFLGVCKHYMVGHCLSVTGSTLTYNIFKYQTQYLIQNFCPPQKIIFCKCVSSFIVQSLVSWNRLLPVGIVLYRYLLVCHAVLSQNLGGEPPILTNVTRGLISASFGSGLITVFNVANTFTYSRCISREETFRFSSICE